MNVHSLELLTAMDKLILDQLDANLSQFWGKDTLDQFARDTLLLPTWGEVLCSTVAVLGKDVVVTVVTLDGDGDYCIWEGAFLEEAWGTDAWFDNEKDAIAHAAFVHMEMVGGYEGSQE